MVIRDGRDRLKEIMKEQGITRNKLASLSGRSRQFIYKFFQNERPPILKTFIWLTDCLGYDIVVDLVPREDMKDD